MAEQIKGYVHWLHESYLHVHKYTLKTTHKHDILEKSYLQHEKCYVNICYFVTFYGFDFEAMV